MSPSPGMSDSPRTLIADHGDERRRLDLMLGRHLTDLRRASRTRFQSWIANGHVCVNGTPIRRAAARVAFGDVVSVVVPDADRIRRARSVEAEDIGIDVLYEDEYLLVLDKPAGVVVHPSYKNATGTTMNALAWRARDRKSVV